MKKQRRRDEIQSQLKGEEPVFGFGPDLRASAAPNTELDERINKLEQSLDNLSCVYTDKHPDVISTKETLSATQGASAKKNARPCGESEAPPRVRHSTPTPSISR